MVWLCGWGCGVRLRGRAVRRRGAAAGRLLLLVVVAGGFWACVRRACKRLRWRLVSVLVSVGLNVERKQCSGEDVTRSRAAHASKAGKTRKAA
jgi:hypothetical protein